jgi:hypothetical protein
MLQRHTAKLEPNRWVWVDKVPSNRNNKASSKEVMHSGIGIIEHPRIEHISHLWKLFNNGSLKDAR